MAGWSIVKYLLTGRSNSRRFKVPLMSWLGSIRLVWWRSKRWSPILSRLKSWLRVCLHKLASWNYLATKRKRRLRRCKIIIKPNENMRCTWPCIIVSVPRSTISFSSPLISQMAHRQIPPTMPPSIYPNKYQIKWDLAQGKPHQCAVCLKMITENTPQGTTPCHHILSPTSHLH